MSITEQATMTDSTASRVRMEQVAFRSGDATLAGNLFTPEGANPGNGLATAVVTGTWTSIKEQMADRYAAKLAERGFAALAFDFAGFGASGGEPREVESASRKVEDIRSAVDFLVGRPEVDGGRIGALAVCASAMYAALASVGEPRLRALALVAPWLHDAKLVEGIYGGPDAIQEKLEAADVARERYERTGVVEYVPAADADDPRAAMPMAIDFYRDPARGALPGWPNRFAVVAWREWLSLDAIATAPSVTAPTLIVHSPDGAIPDGAKRFYAALTCDKDFDWTIGDQFAFYDRPATVDHAVTRAADWFGTHLTGSGKR